MKQIYIYLIFSILIFSCTNNKVDQLTGVWKIYEIDRSNYKSIFDIPGAKNSAYKFPEYDSHQKPVRGNLFYLANEDNATIEFMDDKHVRTTLFFANYGEKVFEYYPDIDSLKIKFIHFDSVMSSTGAQILYEGRFTFKTDHNSIWELDNGMIIEMRKEKMVK